MERNIMEELTAWRKNKKDRKPLILYGSGTENEWLSVVLLGE